MTTGSKLEAELNDVPDVLLDSEHESMRDDAFASLNLLASLTPDLSTLVVIGGGGSGKSSVVNALVGSDVVGVSPVRPTTLGVTVIGRTFPARMEGVAEYVFTDGLADGIVIADTPSWDRNRDVVVAATSDAHTVVVVLTPARYGDAVSAEIVSGLPDTARLFIIANRMPVDPDENDDVLDDIEELFGEAVYAQVAENEKMLLPPSLLSDMPVDESYMKLRRAHERAAARSGRDIARSISASAVELGDVERTVADMVPPSIDGQVGWAGDDWPASREALVAAANDAVAAVDQTVVDRSDNQLARRIRDRLALPDLATLPATIDEWMSQTAVTFRRRSSPRWRRKSTFRLLDRWSWIVSTDVEAKPPRRVNRAMRGALDATARTARADLVAMLDEPALSRLSQWATIVAEVGEYRPGALFAASDDLDGGETADG